MYNFYFLWFIIQVDCLGLIKKVKNYFEKNMLCEVLFLNKKKINNVWLIRCDLFEKYEFKLVRYVIGFIVFYQIFLMKRIFVIKILGLIIKYEF